MKYFLCICLSLAFVLTLSACVTPKEAPPASSSTAVSQSEVAPPISSVPNTEMVSSVAAAQAKAPVTTEEAEVTQTQGELEVALQISIQANGNTVVFELNNSQAAKNLYAQLPLSIEVENYSDNEKIFYPTKALDVTDAPLHSGGGSGTLAYYSPWDNVVIFYGDSNPAGGLYELGHAVSGSEYISSMSGTIEVAQVSNQ